MKLSTLEKAIFSTQKSIENLENKVEDFVQKIEVSETFVEYDYLTDEMKLDCDDLHRERMYLIKLQNEKAKRYRTAIKTTKKLISSIEKEIQTVLHQSLQTGVLERLQFDIPQSELLTKLNKEVYNLKIESLNTQLELHKELLQHLQKGANL